MTELQVRILVNTDAVHLGGFEEQGFDFFVVAQERVRVDQGDLHFAAVFVHAIQLESFLSLSLQIGVAAAFRLACNA